MEFFLKIQEILLKTGGIFKTGGIKNRWNYSTGSTGFRWRKNTLVQTVVAITPIHVACLVAKLKKYWGLVSFPQIKRFCSRDSILFPQIGSSGQYFYVFYYDDCTTIVPFDLVNPSARDRSDVRNIGMLFFEFLW